MEIDKKTFESRLYVATSAHLQVYESVKPHLQRSYDGCKLFILGDKGEEELARNNNLENLCVTFVCLDAFLYVFRQLDLVLTPTGFGVVQNNTVSPASKSRVDALHAQLLYRRETAKCELVRALCNVNGWGDSEQAKDCIRNFYDICHYSRVSLKPADYDQWCSIQQPIMEADLLVRRKISDAQMDALLALYRNGTRETKYTDVIRLIRDITTLRIYNTPAINERMRRLLSLIEGDSDTFKEYFNSDEYKANHNENFENTKDAPAFFFCG